MTAWIEVGLPDAERLHRGSKLAERAVVYTHRDVTQLLAQLAGKKIHRAEAIAVYALERRFVAELAGRIERRTTLALSVTERSSTPRSPAGASLRPSASIASGRRLF